MSLESQSDVSTETVSLSSRRGVSGDNVHGYSQRQFTPLTFVQSTYPLVCWMFRASGPPLPTESDAAVDSGMEARVLKITSPASGAIISEADDLDNDPNNGLFQIKVTASLPRGVFGDATLTINGADPVVKAIEGDDIEFDVSLPAQMNNSYVLAVNATGIGGTEFSDSITVNVRINSSGG